MKGIRILSLVLIITGVVGFFNFALLLINSVKTNHINIFSLAIISTLSISGIIAGCFVSKKELWAYALSIIYFAVQIPIITAGSFYYKVYSGIEMHFILNFGNFSVGINILATVMLFFTLYLFSKINGIQLNHMEERDADTPCGLYG